jgi:hypothetical protein
MTSRPFTVTDYQLDHAIEKNAALRVRLRHTIAKLHRVDGDHQQSVSWLCCPHEECRRAVELLNSPQLVNPS